MTIRPVAAIVLSLLLLPVRAQQPSPKDPPKSLPQRPTEVEQKKTPDVDQDDVVRITTNVVQIDAVVTKDGKLVTDLKAEDFEIFEDKKPQKITNFSYISNVPKTVAPAENIANSSSRPGVNVPVAPRTLRANEPHRTIAIVIDDLGIAFESIGAIRKQVRRFIEQDMRPNDLVAIIRTGGEIGALQQFTTDKRLLMRAAENLRWNNRSRMGVSVFQSGELDNGAPLSAAYQPLRGTTDALKVILQGMRKMPGRKSMIILSDSLPLDDAQDYLPSRRIAAQVPTQDTGVSDSVAIPEQYGNEGALKNVAELAIRSSVVIYGASTTGVQPLGPFPESTPPWEVNLRPAGDQPFLGLNARSRMLSDNSAGLDLIARKTGGFAVKYSNNFGLKRFAQDQEGYYLLGYRPSTETFNRRFHSIKVRVRRPGLTVRTRSGFFGMSDEEVLPIENTTGDQIALALMSPFGASEIEVYMTALFANLHTTGSLIRSLIHFPAGTLTFTDAPNSEHKASLNLSCVVFGDNGQVVQLVSETRELRLNEKTYEQVLRNGLTYQYDLPIKKHGAYQFRVAVRDAGSGRIGTAREYIDVPELKKRQLALSGITLSGETAGANSTGSPVAFVDTKQGNPAIRRFQVGTNLLYAYAIYNARFEKGTRTLSLLSQAKLFRDGKVVYEGQLKPIDVAGQNDLERITVAGGVQLGSVLEPGDYLLQITVTDPLLKGKQASTSKWVDFEIVK